MQLRTRPVINPIRRIWSLDGETLTVEYNGESFTIDLGSVLPNDGDRLTAPVRLPDNSRVIDSAERIDGELHVTIFESVHGGNWWFSDWADGLPPALNGEDEEGAPTYASKRLPKQPSRMTEQEKQTHGIA